MVLIPTSTILPKFSHKYFWIRKKEMKNRDAWERNIPVAARYHIPLTAIKNGRLAPSISELSLFRNLSLFSKNKKHLAFSSTSAKLKWNKYRIRMLNVFLLLQKISIIITKSAITFKDKTIIKSLRFGIAKPHSSKDSPKSIWKISKNNNSKLLLPPFSLFCWLSASWF